MKSHLTECISPFPEKPDNCPMVGGSVHVIIDGSVAHATCPGCNAAVMQQVPEPEQPE